MKHKRYIVWPAVVVPALCAFGSRGEQVSLHPAQGLTLAKSFTEHSELTLEDSSLKVNGNAMDMGMEMSTSSDYKLGVTDEYGTFEGGRSTKITRTFSEISSSSNRSMSNQMMPDDMSSETSGTSELQGLTVVFSWNGEDFDVAFAEEGGDAELLEDLDVDLDFSRLLPEGEVEKGGEPWTIDPNAFRNCFVPGGALKIDLESDDENGPEPSPDQLFGEFEGTATGQLVDIVEEGGARIAVIHLKTEISSAKDLTSLMQEMVEDAPAPEGMEMEMEVQSVDSEFSFEGEGELRWNIEAGVLHSLEMTGEVDHTMDTSMSMSMAGQEMEMENSMTLSGSSSIKVTVTIES